MKDVSGGDTVEITRPNAEHWDGILDVLKTANFHHIGGPEMEHFPLQDCFVALVNGLVRGVGGYRVLSATEAKTTLLAVDARAAAHRLGVRLQEARLNYLRSIGIRSVTTNTDDPRVMRWLERDYGFRRTGETVAKVASFGNDAADRWTTMRLEW